MKDGNEFNWVNVEDASTRAGSCTERVAIFSAIAAGYKKGNSKIYIVEELCPYPFDEDDLN